jgi:hypothetical protein
MTTDSKTTMSVPPAKPAGSCAMVIFGAGGDLTKRLVVPALYNLATGGLLPKEFALIGVDIADFTTDQWRQHLTDMMQSFLAGGGEFQPELIDTIRPCASIRFARCRCAISRLTRRYCSCGPRARTSA